MTLRETIARALGEKHFDLKGYGLAFANEYADAVLDAMIEAGPTEAMIAAGSTVGTTPLPNTARLAWERMLTAAKEESLKGWEL